MAWPDLFLIALIAPLVVPILLARIRRRYRRKKIRIRLMKAVAALGVFPVLRLVMAIIYDPAHLSGVAVGAVFGVTLGLAGMLTVRFERDQAGLWYCPDPYTGSIVLVVILGWLWYRLPHLGIFVRTGVFSLPVSAPWGLFAPATILGYWYANFAGILRYVWTEDPRPEGNVLRGHDGEPGTD